MRLLSDPCAKVGICLDVYEHTFLSKENHAGFRVPIAFLVSAPVRSLRLTTGNSILEPSHRHLFTFSFLCTYFGRSNNVASLRFNKSVLVEMRTS